MGALPGTLNAHGGAAFRLVTVAELGDDACDVLLCIDPIVFGLAEPAAVCLASGDGQRVGPHHVGFDMVQYARRPDCRRLALHEGPHAHLVDAMVHAFDVCRCAEAFGWDRPCWHGADAVTRCDPDLNLWVAP